MRGGDEDGRSSFLEQLFHLWIERDKNRIKAVHGVLLHVLGHSVEQILPAPGWQIGGRIEVCDRRLDPGHLVIGQRHIVNRFGLRLFQWIAGLCWA